MLKFKIAAVATVGVLLLTCYVAYVVKYGLPEPVTLEEGLLY